MAKTPEILCGRKVWIDRAGGPGSVPQVWVHADIRRDAVIYLKGTALDEGTAEENRAYLEQLCAERLSKLKPMSEAMESLWDSHRRELDELADFDPFAA